MRYKWGSWMLGTQVDQDGNIEWGPDGLTLFHDGGPYGIDLNRFSDVDDLLFWLDHLAGKTWWTPRKHVSLTVAYNDLNPGRLTEPLTTEQESRFGRHIEALAVGFANGMDQFYDVPDAGDWS